MAAGGTDDSRRRQRSSVSPLPVHSARVDPKAYGASATARRRSSRHSAQSSSARARSSTDNVAHGLSAEPTVDLDGEGKGTWWSWRSTGAA
jgi:hypothetical protein